jgi:hypothetical protein
MIEPAHHDLSISAQCRLLRISRSSYYYAPVRKRTRRRRRNWFVRWCRCGRRDLARAMTIIEGAKMNGLDPQAYIADVLDCIHDHKVNRLDELLPWHWAALRVPQARAA